jgi:hypothetical protein
METITKPEGDLINIESIKQCLEYSEKPEELTRLLSELSITSEYIKLSKYFEDDSDKRMVLLITIKRNNREISFEFGMSINESMLFDPEQYRFKERVTAIEKMIIDHKMNLPKIRKEIFNNLLYSVLCCVRSDYFIPISFKDFCSEFGYDDSIKAKNIWKRCLEQSSKLQKIFTDDEIECLPS